MPKFSPILKYKKTIFFVFLALMFAGSLTAKVQTAHADDCDTGWYNAVSTCVCRNQQCVKVSYTSTSGWGDQCHTNAQCTGQANTGASWAGKVNPLNTLSETVQGFFKAILSLAFILPLFLSAFVADTAGLLLQAVLFFNISGGIIKSSGVTTGWSIVRDLANMMVVLGFVVIGIATALRIKEWEAKKLLPKLIIVALLINFSPLICGIIIDGSNITMNYLWSAVNNIKDSAGNVIGVMLFPNVNNSLQLISGVVNPDSGFLTYCVVLESNIFYNFIAFFIYILYAVILLARFVFLMMLVILSPLAFVCYAFPATRSVWQTWWKNFFQWCIIGIPMGLFYYIGALTMKELSKGVSFSAPITDAFAGTPDVASAVLHLVSIMLPGLFLIGGFMISLQFSAMGAGAIMNFANKNKGAALKGGLGVLSKAGGTLGKASGWVGNKLQKSNNPIGKGAGSMFNAGAKVLGGYQKGVDWAQARSGKTRSAVGRGLAAIGAIPEGAGGVADIKTVEEQVKRTKFEYDRAKLTNNRPTIDRIRNDARTAGGTKGAASYKVISDAKDLTDTFKDSHGNVDFGAIHSRGRFAELSGAQGVVASNQKLDPRSRGEDEYLLEEKGRSMFPGVKDAHKDPLYKDQIKTAVVADGFKKATSSEIGNYHKSVLGSAEFRVNVQATRVESAARTGMSSEGVEEVKKLIPELRQDVRRELSIPSSATEADVRKAVASASQNTKDRVKEMYDKINTFKTI